MLAVGRRRESDHDCPPGVRPINGRWYWSPTKKADRDERRRKKLKASVPLGIAGSTEARKKWALLDGKDSEDVKSGTVNELLTRWEQGAISKRPNGKDRAKGTVRAYSYAIPHIRKRFADARYGKTEIEAMRGTAIGTADIQQFIVESGSIGKRYLAVMKNAFDYGIRVGLTTYNPCDKAVAEEGDPREREPLEWEVECLSVLATPVMELILAYKVVSGYRISEVIGTRRRQFTPDGIRVKPGKGAQMETLLWSPEIRRIVAAAEQLPRATLFPASPLFPCSKGTAYRYAGFNKAWTKLKAATNAALAEVGIIDVDTLEIYQGLVIEDLNAHDLRSKVHDDAEAMGREGHEAIGNTERMSDKHYARRERKRRPLK